ncbi:MAG: hypothetical protein KDA91_00845 [Planctomycetaceae bacterium]|nr:hypothetical protein [Planctomycetaceae bacterium]
MASSAEDQSPISPQVTNSFTGVSPECWRRWVGDFSCLWPSGIPTARRVSVVSSRLPAALDRCGEWFARLRTLMLRLDPVQDIVCVVESHDLHRTHVNRLVHQAARLFGVPVLQIVIDCGRHPSSEKTKPTEDRMVTEQFSCILQPVDRLQGTDCDSIVSIHRLQQLPLIDRVLFVVSERLCVLDARSGGHTQQLLRHHAVDNERADILIHHVVQHPDASESLQRIDPVRRILVPWYLFPSGIVDDHPLSAQESAEEVRDSGSRGPATENDGPLNKPEEWLLHWTRSRRGPWPDQSDQAWFEELILGVPSANRSALAVLMRILMDRKILASSEAIRGGYRMVAFTQVPLEQFRKRHCFRRHRHRFDFEPWGIAVRKRCLFELGARPVIYGDDNNWQEMDEFDRPWFQRRTGKSGEQFDSEREWRLAGDLSFGALPASDVIVFVDDTAAVDHLAPQVPYQVIAVPPEAA